jgi:integrase
VGDIIQTGDDFIIFVWGKGHDEPDQKQYLLPEVKAAIDEYLQARTDKYTSKSPLFVSTSNKGKPGSLKGYKKDRCGNFVLNANGDRVKVLYDGRIAPNTISSMLKDMLVNAGYNSERYTAHSLRHTSGTAAFKCGLDLYDVQHLMRHCDPKTTEIYIHTDDDAEREKAGRRAIYDYLFNGQTVSGILPELEAEIMTLTADQQKELLAQIRAQKGAK